MANMETIRNREVRGCILRALAKSPFRAISSKTIASALMGTFPAAAVDINVQLAYLADKGYISTVDVSKDDVSGIDLMVNLTARGVDLIEENILADPGITL
jgi:hypothetical protein